MNTTDRKPTEAMILARMAATRAELIAANHAHALGAAAKRGVLPPTMQEGPIFLQSPYAGLIAAALVVSTILGPRI